MKKALFLVLIFVIAFSTMSSAAALKWSFGGSFSTSSFSTQPTLVCNIDDKWDVVAGYQSITNGSGNDANSKLLLGGTMWMFSKGSIDCGWSAYYLADAFPNGAKASDNTLTSINVGFTAKTALVSGVTLRGDAILLSSVSGKVSGADAGGSCIAPNLQLSILFDFM